MSVDRGESEESASGVKDVQGLVGPSESDVHGRSGPGGRGNVCLLDRSLVVQVLLSSGGSADRRCAASDECGTTGSGQRCSVAVVHRLVATEESPGTLNHRTAR